ncbi:MAG: MATE family efflux transporter [Pseudomonadota bacterium]
MGGLQAIRAEVPGLFGLSVPIVVGLGASTLLGVTDSVMLAPLGPVPLAAVGLTGGVALIFYAAIYGLLTALSVRIGAAYGAGAGRQIALIWRNGLALGAVVGLGGAVLMGLVWPLLPLIGQPADVLAAMGGYYAAIAVMMIPFAMLTAFKSACEAVDRPWMGTGFAFVAVAVNVPLNYALIWGIGPLPMLGLTGAGIATVVAESIALALAWGWWRRARSTRRLRLRRPLVRSEMLATAREGAPLGALYVAETGAMAVGTMMLGTFGTVALAANQVAFSVGGLLYMVPLGIAGAVSIRIAQARGADLPGSLRPIAFAGLGMAVLWLSGSALVLALAGAQIAALITDAPEVVALATVIFLVFALMQVADGVQSTMLGALRGMSDTGYPAQVSMVAYWLVALPLGWLFAAWVGPAGIWLGFFVALIGAGAALTRRFWRKTA